MAIHRKTGSGFTNISNEGVRDKRLSWEAKGLLWFLLTEPSEAEIEEVANESPESFNSMIEALRVEGYLFQWSVGNGTSHTEVSEFKRNRAEWLSVAKSAIGGMS